MTPEGLVKKSICDYLAAVAKQHRIFFWSQSNVGIYDPTRKCFRKMNSPYQRRGVSDLLGSIMGRPFCIEVKAGKNTATAEQLSFMHDALEAGWLVGVAYSIEDARRILRI